VHCSKLTRFKNCNCVEIVEFENEFEMDFFLRNLRMSEVFVDDGNFDFVKI
jgi:hypothetical protein